MKTYDSNGNLVDAIQLTGSNVPLQVRTKTDTSEDKFENNIYSWWIHPLAIHDAGYRRWTVHGGLSSDGKRQVYSLDHVTGEVEKFTLAQFPEADDHDAPAIIKRPDYKIMAIYSRHNQDNLIRYRIAKKADSIADFEPEQTLESPNGTTTYVQAFNYYEYIHIFYRVAARYWAHRRLNTNTGVWSGEKLFFDGNSYYFKFMQNPTAINNIRFILQGHPTAAAEHASRSGAIKINDTGADAGQIIEITPAGSAILGQLYDASAPLTLSSFSAASIAVAEPVAGTTRRLLDVSYTSDICFLFADINESTLDITYKMARRSGGAWVVNTLATVKSVIYETTLYLGGMVFVPGTFNKAYMSMEDTAAGLWRIQYWQGDANGAAWAKSSDTVSDKRKLMRPICVFGDTNNLVLYQRGRYDNFENVATENFKTDTLWSGTL